MDILEIFNDATLTFSHVYKPTSSIFCCVALDVASALSEGYQIPELSNVVAQMRLKWLQYYKVIPDIFLVAFVFDPRYKMSSLQQCLENYFPLLGVEDDIDCNVSHILSTTRSLLDELYEKYRTDSDSAPSPLPPASSSSRPGVVSRLSSRLLGPKRARSSSSSASTAVSEVEFYLTTNYEFPRDQDPDDFDLLAWWRERRDQYPTLSKIAAQLLVVPASTVAVEQTFSQGGQILDEKRSNLHPDTLEAQVCINDWRRAELMQQKNILSSTSEPSDDAAPSSATATTNTTTDEEE